MIVSLDIETLPLAASLVGWPEPAAGEPSSEAWLARVKDCSLSPMLGRVLAVGLVYRDEAEAMHEGCLWAEGEDEERAMLVALWRYVAKADRIVTWNGSFDLHFLRVRSIVLGVEPAIAPERMVRWFVRYQHGEHFDCKAALSNWEWKAGHGLDEWAQALGFEAKPMHGSAVFNAFRAGRHEEIRDYAKHDARVTMAIYDRIHRYFPVATWGRR